MDNPFKDIRVIGALPLSEAAARLEEIDDRESAAAVEDAITKQTSQRALKGGSKSYTLSSILGKTRKWAHTAHSLGFIARDDNHRDELEIRHAGNISADTNLLEQPLKISLNALRIASYPGFGTHNVLLDFYVQSRFQKSVDHLHFSATYRGEEGEHAAVIGQPIFLGVVPPSTGLAMHCLTVNVKNEGDEKLISLLGRDVFKSGLRVLKTMQPAVAPLSEMILGLVTGLAKRSRNVPVQNIYIGLDFGGAPGGARLALGTYVAIQVPEKQHVAWNWKDWIFDCNAGRIVLKSHKSTLVPYNYIAFGVDSYAMS